eukprot:TRINITY_DN3239_c0_g1_i1.p1 TRINITY_DN3239_c0_g1~~TRINITY_DN3239_c0_g1_i1.p1  ORF type:complete len:140 (-),score=26.08 TRINITY_DN3239_c0_g1_i1:54-473(-)
MAKSARDQLFTYADGTTAKATIAPGIPSEDEPADTAALIQQQDQVIQQQDATLDAIEQSVLRTKELAGAIGTEVKDQNKIITNLEGHVDRTDRQLQQATEQTLRVERKATNNVLLGVICLLIVLLVVVIILAISLPGPK